MPAPIIDRTTIRKIDGEYVVKAYSGKKRIPEADYFTNDRDDAEATAYVMVRPLPGRDSLYHWATKIVGMNLTRRTVRSWDDYQSIRALLYIEYVWLRANDNMGMRRVKRPAWFPKEA